jgi:hypothetical protein
MSITVHCFFSPAVIAGRLFLISIYDRALPAGSACERKPEQAFREEQAADQDLFSVRISNGENKNAASTSWPE